MHEPQRRRAASHFDARLRSIQAPRPPSFAAQGLRGSSAVMTSCVLVEQFHGPAPQDPRTQTAGRSRLAHDGAIAVKGATGYPERQACAHTARSVAREAISEDPATSHDLVVERSLRGSAASTRWTTLDFRVRPPHLVAPTGHPAWWLVCSRSRWWEKPAPRRGSHPFKEKQSSLRVMREIRSVALPKAPQSKSLGEPDSRRLSLWATLGPVLGEKSESPGSARLLPSL